MIYAIDSVLFMSFMLVAPKMKPTPLRVFLEIPKESAGARHARSRTTANGFPAPFLDRIDLHIDVPLVEYGVCWSISVESEADSRGIGLQR